MSRGPYVRRERPGTRAICTCAKSTMLPYCDGAHLGTGREPIMMNFEAAEEVAWCLCRKSKAFPRCDGSHEARHIEPLRNDTESTAIYSRKAEDYAAYRPDYAGKATHALVELTRLDSTRVVADIGSGTGNLSRHLVDRTRRVFAVEPNDAMRHQAEHLLSGSASFQSIRGTAEQTTLPDHSVDLITVGQALHWFEGRRARQEFARILKPCGLLAVLWNRFDGSEQACIDDYFAPATCERRSFPVSIRETWEGFIGGARSAASAPVRGEPDYDDFEKAHRREFDSRARDGRIEVSYTTELVVGQLRGRPEERDAAADADRPRR